MAKFWQRDKKKAQPAAPKELQDVHKRLDRVEGRVSYIEKSLDVFKAKGA